MGLSRRLPGPHPRQVFAEVPKAHNYRVEVQRPLLRGQILAETLECYKRKPVSLKSVEFTLGE